MPGSREQHAGDGTENMGRWHKPQQDQPYPPIPDELLALINKDGEFRFRRILVEEPDGSVSDDVFVGDDGSVSSDPRLELLRRTCERLQREYCDAAGIRLSDFRRVVAGDDLGPRRKPQRRDL
jgi:hypothetical protein